LNSNIHYYSAGKCCGQQCPRGVDALKRGKSAYVSLEVLLLARGSTTSTWLGGEYVFKKTLLRLETSKPKENNKKIVQTTNLHSIQIYLNFIFSLCLALI